MKLFLYFSELINLDVIDASGENVGGLQDIVMNPTSDIYPKATEIIVRHGMAKKTYARVAWDQIAYIEDEARLKIDESQMQFSTDLPRADFTLRRDILDQQVVDTEDQKVVRVNDIHMLRVENQLYAAHVDVGTRALVRRLEWTPVVDTIVRTFKPKSPYLKQEDLIPWKAAHVLPKLGRLKNVVKVDVARNRLSSIPPAALAEIMQDLDIYVRASLFKSLESSIQQKVFTDLTMGPKLELIDALTDDEVANLISNIPADEATDLLLKLPRAKTSQLMRLLGSDTSKKLFKLLGFAKDSAGGLMTTEYLYLPKESTVADGMKKIKDNTNFHGSIFFLYIVDEHHKYLGATSLRRFINEPPEKPLIETCYRENIYVYTDDDVQEVALLLERYKFSSIPVLNHDDILQGVITIDDVLEELISLAWVKYKEKL